MAVVNLRSNLFRREQNLDDTKDPEMTRGRPIITTGAVSNDATDSATSMYRLCDLPSDCLMGPDTFFDVTSWGYAQIQIGTRDDAVALIDQTKATENVVQPFALADANHDKRLWEILGLAEDPGGVIALFAHAAANATGAGFMKFQVHYIHR